VCSVSIRTKVVMSFEQGNIRRTLKNIGILIYIHIILMHFFMYQAYIIHYYLLCGALVQTWTTHRRFLTVFFYSFRPIHGEENIYRPVRLKNILRLFRGRFSRHKRPAKSNMSPTTDQVYKATKK